MSALWRCRAGKAAIGALPALLAGCGGAAPAPQPPAHISPSFLSVASYSPTQVTYGVDLDRFNTKWWLGGATLADIPGQTAMLRNGYHFLPSFNTGYIMRTQGLTEVPVATTKAADPHSCIDSSCVLNHKAILAVVQRARRLLGGTGNYYNIGNEVDNASSDDVSPTVYVEQFDAWVNAIKSQDRSARIVAPSIDAWSCCTTKMTNPFGTAGRWFQDFVSAYRQAHSGANPPIDVLSMHLYNFDPNTAQVSANQADNYVKEVRDFRRAADNLGYRGRPIWITEFGFLYRPPGPLTPRQRDQVTRVTTELADAAAALRLQRVFWFTDNEQVPTLAGLRPLYDPKAISAPNAAMPLSDLGQLVASLGSGK